PSGGRRGHRAARPRARRRAGLGVRRLRPRNPAGRLGRQRQPSPARLDPPLGVRAPGQDRCRGGTDRGRRLLPRRRVGEAPGTLRPGGARHRQRARCASRERTGPRTVGGLDRALLRRRPPGGSAPARRRAAPRSGEGSTDRRAPRVVDVRPAPRRRRAWRMTLGPGRGGLRAWAGGAVLTAPLIAFGILRPDDGSVPFFVLLGLASVGYLATVFQVANG